MRLKQIFILTAIALVTFASCKKGPDPSSVDGTRAELTKDSIFLYAKQIYLWKDGLPSYEAFNPRKYTSKSTDFLNYERELIELAKLVKNPLTGLGYEYFTRLDKNGKPVEVDDSKYSYISDIADKNPTAYIPNKKSAVDLEGNGNDFGIKIGAYGQNPTPATDEFALFVTAVYQNSPADKQGVIRSDRIYKINGRQIGDSFSVDQNFINTSFNDDKITIEGVRYINGAAGAPYTLTLNKAIYESSPLYAAKVFTVGAKKIGYFAYARFSTLTNSQPGIDSAFAKFAAANVTDLIIDLRYNGGGYVKTAEYLINQIAPSTLSGEVMYSEHYNSLMQSGGATILKNQPLLDENGKIKIDQNTKKIVTYADINYSIAANTEKFQKNGPLTGVTKVVFIVSGNTASASELVINSLKPYITVKLVGTQTYGKPVGFFPVRLENKYDVFYSLFQTKNSLGQGDYYSGFAPDVKDTFDDPRNNFGDPKERYISLALNDFGVTTPVTTAARKTMSINGKNVSVQSLKPMKPIVNGNEFIGMIETNHKLKK